MAAVEVVADKATRAPFEAAQGVGAEARAGDARARRRYAREGRQHPVRTATRHNGRASRYDRGSYDGSYRSGDEGSRKGLAWTLAGRVILALCKGHIPQAAVAAARPGRLLTFAGRNWRHIAEILFIVPAYTAYQYVRGAVHGQAGTAFDNATRLIHIEKQLGIFHEAFLQQLILPKGWIVDLFNYLYIWGHLPVIIAVALWLYMSHRDELRAVPQRVPDLRADRAHRVQHGAAGAAALHAGVRLHGHHHPRAVVLRVPEPEDREPVRGDAEPALRLGPAGRHRDRVQRARAAG